jgi:molybdenum cofactor biosynthesis protein B
VSESSKKHKASAPKQLKFAIYVCSTLRYQQLQKDEKIDDVSGDIIKALLKSAGHMVLSKEIIADDEGMIAEAVKSVLSSKELDAVIFCGGTGKVLFGFGEIFRRLSYDKVGSAAVMSRAVAGVARGKALFCIPGSPDAVRVSVEMLILPEAPHIVRHIRE